MLCSYLAFDWFRSRRDVHELVADYRAAEVVPDYYDVYQVVPAPPPGSWDEAPLSSEPRWRGAVEHEGSTVRVGRQGHIIRVQFDDRYEPLRISTDHGVVSELRHDGRSLFILVEDLVFWPSWSIHEVDLDRRLLAREASIDVDWIGGDPWRRQEEER
jgi:hypothetical protein